MLLQNKVVHLELEDFFYGDHEQSQNEEFYRLQYVRSRIARNGFPLLLGQMKKKKLQVTRKFF